MKNLPDRFILFPDGCHVRWYERNIGHNILLPGRESFSEVFVSNDLLGPI